MSEDTLTQALRKVARQDRAAFREVYRQSAARLAGVLARMLRDRTEAEDALQDVYVRVWQRAAQFDGGPEAGMGWLVAIARNVALDRLRARPEARGFAHAQPGGDRAEDDPVARLPATDPAVEDRLVAGAQVRRAPLRPGRRQARQNTPPRGAYLEGASYQDLAERFGVPLNTMRTWLRRSLLRLKECLDR